MFNLFLFLTYFCEFKYCIQTNLSSYSPAKMSWNTENASRIVIPKDTRSPDSAGSKNINIVIITRKKHGTKMLSITYAHFRCRNIWNVTRG